MTETIKVKVTDEFRMELDADALTALRYNPAVAKACEAVGRRILDQANAVMHDGEGYEMRSYPGKKNPSGRWQVRVSAISYPARISDRKHNTLTRLLGSA